MSALDDLERDVPRVNERLGDLIPGARSGPIPPATRPHQRRTLLLVDETVHPELTLLALSTLHQQGVRPLSLVVWNEEQKRPGAISFDTARAPLPLDGLVVRLGPDAWSVESPGRPHRASSELAGERQSLVELYAEVASRQGSGQAYVSLQGNVGTWRLAAALAVVSAGQRGRIPDGVRSSLDELLASELEDERSRAAGTPNVTLLVP